MTDPSEAKRPRLSRSDSGSSPAAASDGHHPVVSPLDASDDSRPAVSPDASPDAASDDPHPAVSPAAASDDPHPAVSPAAAAFDDLLYLLFDDPPVTASDDPHPVVSPDTAISLSQPPPDAELFSRITLYTNDTIPSSDNIEFALSVVSDKNTRKKYTDHEIVQVLHDLVRWVSPSNNANDHRIICKEFLDLGGISRVLKFLMVPSNMNDMEYVKFVCMILAHCAHKGNNGEDNDIAIEMAKKFVERGGIHTMLLANEEYNGGGDDIQLKAVKYIWATLTKILSHKIVLYELEKDKLLNLLDDALATLRLLNGVDDAAENARVREPKTLIIYFIGILSCSQNTESVLVAGDFEKRKVFQTCVDALKDSNRHWYYKKRIWSISSKTFINCYNLEFFSTNNNDDLKLIISFFIEYIKKAPNEAKKDLAFQFLQKAGGFIGMAEMAKTPGIMITLGLILDSSNNNYNLNAATELAAKNLLKTLL
ncbi:hypothetical protein FRACYDRAFT_251186 [Fragilariopsis cylindrus CCMP1102]|uniref:Uncharacterized protein n=1 Tax=Fragilariopsis cylindrus CCMP1102 TaxID=635003 RepID=A0A1E7EN69_9STRA|nr:hypothetical protein FRACYDRAFT_251186 [Fragilariopsis cylindrus CCMP1102]|eukprot:OEU07380.1 hypothetical protein FRACYDRAFT_251186 [Fragilariopsis cylindrus CCMP1102]